MYVFKTYINFFADISIFLMTSSNIDSTAGHSCEIQYFVNFEGLLIIKRFFTGSFLLFKKVPKLSNKYFQGKLVDINLHDRKFGENF